MNEPPPAYYRVSIFSWLLWQLGRMVNDFVVGLRESVTWALRSAKVDLFTLRGFRRDGRPRPILTLILLGLPLVFLLIIGPPEWFLNWPVMGIAALVLTSIEKGPLAWAPSFLKKLVKVAALFCLLYGFFLLLNWHPFWAFLGAFGLTQQKSAIWLWLVEFTFWFVSVVRIMFSC